MPRLIILLMLFLFAEANPNSTAASLLNGIEDANATHGTHRVHVASWKWESVSTVFIIAFWLLLASIAKLVFNGSTLTRYFPESTILIVVGLVIGYVLNNTGVDHFSFRLESHAFFIYLLPPIIFDAGYFMPNRAFFQNWDSILVFAVFGTIFNTLAIGGSLLLLSTYGIFTVNFSLFEILLFSALISAVDPVAVIAVFEEIHVNDFIFVNVFGEALFNDGVTVVLYEVFKQFLEIGDAPILVVDYAAGAASFFVVAIGGVIVGIVAAIIVSFLTKHSDHVRTLVPLFIFLVPYMGYLSAEALSLSPIIAIAVCGMVMKQYVKGNMTTSAANSVKYFTKMLASCSETVIFMFLGLSSLSYTHHFDLQFVVLTISLCIAIRAIGVVVQCTLLNRFRGKEFKFVDQFILSYGGLRGAIAFGLASSLPDDMEAKPMFLTTTIIVIFFTVFFMGSTIRPIVNFLKVEKKSQAEPTMAESVYLKYMDYLVSGVEDIAGQKGHTSLVHDFERFNTKVLCPKLMRDYAKTKEFDATKIIRAYAKLILREAITTTAQARPPLNNKRITDLQLEDAKNSPYHTVGPMSRPRPAPGTPLTRCTCQTNPYAPPGSHAPTCPLQLPNMEALYSMFVNMLDKRLDEVRNEIRDHSRLSADTEDISDDYIKQIQQSPSYKGGMYLESDDEGGRVVQRNSRKKAANVKSKSMSTMEGMQARRSSHDGGDGRKPLPHSSNNWMV